MADMASAATGHDGAVASGEGPRAGQPKRRTFTAAYKPRILQEYDELETGRERGALLRREGLYTSHIDGWRKARDAGTENGLDRQAGRAAGTQRRGGGERAAAARRTRNSPRNWRGRRPRWRVVGKAHALLELLSESADSDTKRHK